MSTSPDASTDTDLDIRVFSSPPRPFGDAGATFAPTTSTLLITGDEIVLVDAQLLVEDADALADLIESTGKTLTTILITHGHSDHYFGMDRLRQRFPTARVMAAPSVVAYIRAHRDDDIARMQQWFGDQLAIPTSMPESMPTPHIDLNGHRLHVVEIGRGDIEPSTLIHLPDIGAVIVGDLAYNTIHPMLALGGPAEWDGWIASIRRIEELEPTRVITGHALAGAPDDDVSAILGGTRAYIGDFATAAKTAQDPQELVASMQEKYPTFGNLTTLRVSAAAAFR